MAVYAVIMAGGSGTRLWPLSREGFPKFLLPLFPASLLELAVRRVQPFIPLKNVRIVCGVKQYQAIRKSLPFLKKQNFIIEPTGRNTAPCIGLAAAILSRQDPRALLVILPADPLIRNRRSFQASVRQAVRFATQHEAIMTVGIKPRSPHTGYGYIETEQPKQAGVFKVKQFTEKPDAKTAQRYVQGQRHLWNTGIFVGRAAVFLSELKRWEPKLARGLGTLATGRVTLAAYRRLPAISIDYAVAERSDKMWTVPATFDWEDIGDLQVLSNLQGQAPDVSIGSNRVAVIGKKRFVATVGVQDLVIVETPDALLIVQRDQVQRVKEVVDLLKKKGVARLL